MSEARPSVVILAGPNGAGKSTVAPALLQGALAVNEFVNADVIARGISAFDPDSAAIAAGRVMLTRLHERAGGHDVPAETVRRRYRVGLRNFFHLYDPLVSGWVVYDSSGPRPRLVAERLAPDPPRVYDGDIWTAVTRQGRP